MTTTLLGIPLVIWILVFISTLVRLNNRKPMYENRPFRNAFSYLTTFIVSMTAGLFLHQPLMEFLSLSHEKAIFIAALLALTAENLMNRISKYSETVSMKELIQLWLNGKNTPKK